jgi:hypothetical protein
LCAEDKTPWLLMRVKIAFFLLNRPFATRREPKGSPDRLQSRAIRRQAEQEQRARVTKYSDDAESKSHRYLR